MAKKKSDNGERRSRTPPATTEAHVKEAIAAGAKDGQSVRKWILDNKHASISYGTVLKYYKRLTGGGEAGEPTMSQLTRVRDFARAEFKGLGEFQSFIDRYHKLVDSVGGTGNLQKCIRFWQSQQTGA